MEVRLKNVRLSFPDLWVAQPFKPGDEPKFGATFLIPKGSDQDKQVEKAILEVAEAKWPKKGAATIKSIRGNPNKFNYQDGDTKDYDGYAGMKSISAKNTVRPTVIDRNRNPLAAADGKPYAGCYVNAIVEIFAYTNSGNGISASLSGVQFVKDGDAFAAGKPASADEFDDLGDMGEDEAAEEEMA